MNDYTPTDPTKYFQKIDIPYPSKKEIDKLKITEGLTKSGNHGFEATQFKKGHTPSKEVREKMSKAAMGRKLTEEHKRNISLGNIGNRHTEEAKERMRQKALGRKLAEETKEKISRAQKGKRLAEDHAKRISDTVKGRVHVNNGIINKFVHPDDIPAGFKRGRIGIKRKKQ